MNRQTMNLLIFIFSFLVGALLILFLSGANAGEINIQMDFAYNGLSDSGTQGFNFYQEDPAGIEKKLVQISGPGVRTWSGVVPVDPGRSLYYLTAYGADWESARSNAYPFEYIEAETPGNPPPTIVIKFN